MNKNFLVIGYFGEVSNQLDGQTIKTREVYKLMSRRLMPSNVEKFDTELLKGSKWSFFNLFQKVIRCNSIIYLPGQNNFKLFFPTLFHISNILNKDIIHIVVGGWLVDFIQNKKGYANKLKQIKKVLIESKGLKRELESKFGFDNVEVFPNFRMHHFSPPQDNTSHDTLRAVFMSRVTYSKGIDFLIFRFAERLIKSPSKIIIDLYGPLGEEEKLPILGKIENLDSINYNGVVQPHEVYSVLSSYDVLLLPTSYEGEGFPGAIMDAYIAGIPVIASEWKQIPEFVDHGETGFLFPLNDEQQFFEFIELLSKEKTLLNKLKVQARLKSDQYSSDRAWDILKSVL